MTMNARVLAIVIPLAMVVGIAFGSVTGWWQTESSKEPARYVDGEFAGEANPADIRGSYSLMDVSSAFGISVEVLSRAFLLSGADEPGDILIKEFEERFGLLPGVDGGEREIGTDAMRLFVARYRGLPYQPESDTGIFSAGADLVAQAGMVDEETLADLRARIVEPPVSNSPADFSDSDEEAILVKGNTTFGELMTWGVTEEDIRALLDGDIGARGESVRTWSVENGREFSAIKESLQELVDLAVQ